MPARNRREAEVAVVRPAQPRSTDRAVAGATERRLPGAMEVPIEQVVPDVSQPRQDWAHGEGADRLDELSSSVREFGILQPLLVREDGTLEDGRQRYVIIAGARRRTAAERAGLAALPVVVRGEESARIRVLQLIENLQRQDLSPLDEARAYQELIDAEGLTPPQLAERLHISAQQVRDRLRVLADQVLADAVQRRQLSMTAAREIKKLPDDEVMRFHARILAGEHLQTNDIETTRALLAAAGIVNPRRKAVATKQTSFVPPIPIPNQLPMALPQHEESYTGPLSANRTVSALDHGRDKQTSFVPPAVTETGVVTVPAETSQPAPTSISAERRASAQRLADALDISLQGVQRVEAARLLQDEASDEAFEAWWLLVYEHLRARLEASTRRSRRSRAHHGA